MVAFHGCGGITNNVPIETADGAADSAIFVRGQAVGNCWNDGSADTPDLEFFDGMLDTVSEMACVDENRVFTTGYSSGSWLNTWLTCLRSDRIRAAATITGGNRVPAGQACGGPVARLFLHDLGDNTNKWVNNEPAMKRQVDINGCMAGSKVSEDPQPCEVYQGCEENPGQGVLDQRARAQPSGWLRQGVVLGFLLTVLSSRAWDGSPRPALDGVRS